MTVTRADVEAAAARIDGLVHRTPVLTSARLNEIAGAELYFKAEHLQKAGAFKSRGAVNVVSSLDKNIIKQGVATHSSGNHGAALARAADLRGAPAYIVVPDNASRVKVDAIRSYGAEVIFCEATLKARESTLESVVERTGAVFVHPYDDDRIIAGQGTAALEMIEQARGLDAIITPIGGGGLAAGCALIAESEGVPLFCAEPLGADDAFRSLKAGERVIEHAPDTICDGLLTTLGVRNFDIVSRIVSNILLADDDQTIEAMALIWTRMKQVVEPSSAITLAALLQNRERFTGQRVGLVLTGGNLDLARLPFSS